MSALSFVVDAANAGERADRWLVSALAGVGVVVSRSVARRWLDEGRITGAGFAYAPSDRMRVGATVEVVPAPPPRSDAAPDASVEFDVVYEDDELLVVDKPRGLVVHPARGHAEGTLVNGLLALGSFDLAPADDLDPEGHLRPGVVHRLDKDTSGLLVVAKTARAREGLKALFQTHDVERVYEAIVVGSAVDAKYETLHGRHPNDRLRFSTRVREGKRAVTRVRVVERLAGGRATLVACTLDTGRTHQIRVHLAECGRTPILGDSLYGGMAKGTPLASIAAALDGQALHARVLGFVHPTTGLALRFERPPPEAFEAALAALRALGS